MVSGGGGLAARGGDKGKSGVRIVGVDGDGGGGGDEEQMTGQLPHSLMQSCPATAAAGGPGGSGSVV